ncbi:hypothetical protein JCM17960_19200 [Magnetospira thiophila]
MAKTGSTKTFDRILFRESVFMLERERTPAAEQVRKARKEILAHVVAVGKSGDLDLILATERTLLENDRNRHSNSKAMKGSLETALDELASAGRHLARVREPEAYRAIDEAHSRPKNRIGVLPRDEARQFFSAHAARLLNQDKSRLDEDEKRVVEARKRNMRAGEKLYTTLQIQALGLAIDKSQDHGLTL